jgi:hypothetical protein
MSEKRPDMSPVREPSIDEAQVAAEKQMRDIGADLYLEVRQYSREELEAERKVVLRKIDWMIMPMVCVDTVYSEITPNQNQICITYTIQFLDKLSLNYANAYTLTPDLGLQSVFP